MDTYQLQVIGEVALAMLFGAVIGFERESADKPAGLRTNMLVAGASALLVGLAGTLMSRFAELGPSATISGDPIRVVQAIVLGVSFLGAGTVIRRDGGHVEGLTTGAALLMSAAVGAATAVHLFWIAGGCALLVAIVLRGVGRLERRRR